MSILVLLMLFQSCGEEELIMDQCLIIAKSTSGSYVIVSPSTHKVLYDVKPDLPAGQISRAYLGNNSEKVFLISKEPGGSYVKVIYACDRETGNNLTMLTNARQWDVQSISASVVSPTLVFHGHPADGGEIESNLFKINLDGTGVQQLTQNREVIANVELWWPQNPSVSPNGFKIAFTGTMRTPEPGSYWWGRSLIIMDGNGNNKKILYNEPDANSGFHYDFSWTKDGGYLLFLTNEYSSSPAQRVKVINIENGEIADITQQLMVDGKHTTSLCASPSARRILFNKYEPGGGDLHYIDYEIDADGHFQLSGSVKTMCSRQAAGNHFGEPHWQLYPQQ